MKILNLYAGIGGNRKLWGDSHEITAIEYKPKIAKIYQDHFPNDNVIVGDAHEYLLEHFSEFDFIWSSPPCPSHSRVRFANQKQNKPLYPSMALFQEIILLKHWFKGLWCVENVVAYYEPFMQPQEIANHYFWANFLIPPFQGNGRGMGRDESIENLAKLKGYDMEKISGVDRTLALRNCVEPELAKHIMDFALNPIVLQNPLFTIPNEIKKA